MAYAIVESCVNCYACEPLCPNQAISLVDACFTIDSMLCTECVGDFAEAQCVSICPIEGAIVDEWGEALNPPGSLTGIPPSVLQALRAASTPA